MEQIDRTAAPRAARPAAPVSRQEMELTEEEMAARKEFLEFDDEDVQRLTSISALAGETADPMMREFYQHLLSFEEGRDFFKEPAVLQRVQQAQKEYFLDLTKGTYGADYVENRIGIGTVHERIGLPFKLYLGMYNWYLRNIAGRLFAAFPEEPEKALATFLSLTKLMFLDLGLAIETYLFQRERFIRAQEEALREFSMQQAVRELSTPVLPVREGLLVLPIVGIIDSARAMQLTEQLLSAIRTHRAQAAVIDITGVPIVDSNVAGHLLHTVEAARLMGTSVIVTGLSSEVAQALVRIGVDLSRLKTMNDLRAGLEAAEQLLT